MGEFTINLDAETEASIQALRGQAMMATIQMVQEGEPEKAREWYGYMSLCDDLLDAATNGSERWELLEQYRNVSDVAKELNKAVKKSNGGLKGVR